MNILFKFRPPIFLIIITTSYNFKFSVQFSILQIPHILIFYSDTWDIYLNRNLTF